MGYLDGYVKILMDSENQVDGAECSALRWTPQAMLAYEEKELPRLKEEKPGLKLRQYKQMIFDQVSDDFPSSSRLGLAVPM